MLLTAAVESNPRRASISLAPAGAESKRLDAVFAKSDRQNDGENLTQELLACQIQTEIIRIKNE